MSDENPVSPLDAYQRIIDELVERTPGVIARRVVAGHSIPAVDERDARDFTALVNSLSDSQREVLARLCDSERSGAIHDVLAVLTWWIDCGGLGLTFHGAEMAVDFSGMGLHGDYVGRLQGWNWPTRD